ncbi:MAG TPA: NAD(P)/FAD-dependent oxidoreductase [Candidatus Thermoplasmatota archaeon]|jgi:geranylgeranyl reductase family protein|nr:NAD(P)/FAD-dependent oxidoreductase [Candidatus Thermoplasmatota archaeon]
MRCDVLVVGGGPVGAQVARLMAKRGFSVLMVEEHARVGVPVQCAGLFTPGIFDLVDVPLAEVKLNEIRGAHVRSPAGRTIALDAGKPMAYAINRGGFDQACVRRAEDAGAEVWTHAKAVSFERRDGGVRAGVHRSQQGEVEVDAKLVVGADGAASTVAQAFGLPRAKEMVSCYGAQMRSLDNLTPDKVEMFVGNDIAPGFFGWIVPQGQGHGMVELGVHMSATSARAWFARMREHKVVEPFVHRGEVLYEVAAVIPLGPKSQTTADSVMLVGDAAAQAKPTSGGGVYTGLKCAAHLVDVAEGALEAGDLTDARLRAYHERWTADVGRELRIGMRLRKAFMHLRDDEIEALFEELDDPEAMELINRLGDIDRPSRLAGQLLRRKPNLLRYTARAVAQSLFAD